MAFVNRISKWGVASLMLFLGDCAVGEYNLYLDHQRRQILFVDWAAATSSAPLCSWRLSFVASWATRRQSYWWLLIVPPAAWLALVCFLGDL
jgi:hypothetical protein